MDASRSTDASPGAVGFIGDLDDPWIAAIADAMAANREVRRMNGRRGLPERPFGEAAPPRAIVVHRHHLSAIDSRRVVDWRSRAGEPAPVVILCISPYVRYEELERSAGVFDLVVSEATAADVLPARLARMLDGRQRLRPPAGIPACRIEVAGGDDELCRALVETCDRAGYPAGAVDEQEIGGDPFPRPRPRDRPAASAGRVLTIWEVPVLEPGWAHRLEWRAHRNGPVIALAGFADRAVVARARASGAVACLELPCDLDDLVDAVDRVVSATPTESWPIPPRAEAPHILPPPRRKPRRRGSLVVPSTWPERGPLPRIQ